MKNKYQSITSMLNNLSENLESKGYLDGEITAMVYNMHNEINRLDKTDKHNKEKINDLLSQL